MTRPKHAGPCMGRGKFELLFEARLGVLSRLASIHVLLQLRLSLFLRLFFLLLMLSMTTTKKLIILQDVRGICCCLEGFCMGVGFRVQVLGLGIRV